MAERPKIGCLGIIVICASVVWLIGALSDKDSPNTSAHSPSAPSASERQIAAKIQAENAVELVLKAPASADFQSFPEVRHDPDRKLYSVIGYVDAQNSFGALIRNDYVVILQQLCDDLYSRNCWDTLQLGLGDQVYKFRDIPSKPDKLNKRRSATTASANQTSAKTDPTNSTASLQKFLISRGFDPGPADGVMGPKTKTAFQEFQKAHNLPDNTPMDANTLNGLVPEQ